MTQPPKKIISQGVNSQSNQTSPSKKSDAVSEQDIVVQMENKINQLSSLKKYKTRELVEDTEKLGKKLAKGLKTTQIRKFLDAINRIKARIIGMSTLPEDIQSELHLLRPKLAYAAARQAKDGDPGPVEPLKKVLEAALKKDMEMDDFFRLVQLIESIIAYHKAAGGKDQ